MSEFQFPSFKLLQPLANEVSFQASPKKSSLLPTQSPEPMVLWSQLLTTEQLFSFSGGGYTDMGKLYRPAGFFGFNDVHGLVIMSHGQLPAAYDEAYKYAMDHIGRLLAHLGYVCISIAPRKVLNDDKSDSYSRGTSLTMIRHLVHVNGIFGDGLFIKGKPLALIGHSQAGGRALEAAVTIIESKISGYTKVDAIIGLAPSQSYTIGSKRPTRAFLCMGGTCDGDQGLNHPGLALASYESVSQIEERYFLLLHRCNHRQFTKRSPVETDHILPDPAYKSPVVGSDTQNIVAAQFSAMFLLWKLQGQDKYRAVFTGEKRVNFVDKDTMIQTELNLLRVLPRFDRARNVALGSFPDAFSAKNIWGYKNPPQNTYKPLQEFDSSCFTQTTKAFVRVWDAQIKSQLFFLCNPKNMGRQIAAVEFHAIVLAQADLGDLAAKSANVQMYFKYGQGGLLESTHVSVNIERPWSFLPQLSVPSTIRIPMGLFGFNDLAEQATAVKLVVDFTGCTRQTGAIAITECKLAFT